MLRRALFGSTVLSATVLLGQAAIADVTVEDVRAANAAYIESLGGQVFETVTTDGDDTVLTENAWLFRFPFDLGTLRVVAPDYRMTPQADGTVTMTFDDTILYRIEVDIPSEMSGAMNIFLTQDNHTATASGMPGDVTFAQTAGDFDVTIEAKDGMEDVFDLALVAQGSSYETTARVQTGDMVTVTTTSATSAMDLAYALTDLEGALVSETSQLGGNVTSAEWSLPAGGSNVLNLEPVFESGAYLRGTVEDEGGTSETITTIDGQVISEEFQKTGQTTSRFSIDKNGLDIFGETGPAEFRVMMPDLLPFPIEGSVAGGVGAVVLPLLASDTAQDIAMRLDLTDLILSEDLWGIFDPAGDLPREPVSMNIDVAGSVLSDIDFLNFDTLEDQLSQGVPPISAESVTINEISIAALGASALATGAFTLDNTDTATFDGFPRPAGSAILNVTGANALLDRLVALGVIGSDEAGMARLGMGFIARATGDDAFESRLDVNPDGHVMVNGQRMR